MIFYSCTLVNLPAKLVHILFLNRTGKMVGRRKETKNCVECGKAIGGYKDYCAPCHERILEKIKNLKKIKRNRNKLPSSGTIA